MEIRCEGPGPVGGPYQGLYLTALSLGGHISNSVAESAYRAVAIRRIQAHTQTLIRFVLSAMLAARTRQYLSLLLTVTVAYTFFLYNAAGDNKILPETPSIVSVFPA
jgi:hypothetical protein